jgi:3-oxoadipate enol-lactonase
MPHARVNEISIYYEIHGEGEPLVMIQGLGFELSPMVEEPGRSRYLDRVARRYRVILFDCRGVGRTDKPDSPYSIEMLARDTVGLMDALGIRRAHVMGTSMGSMVAQEIAATYPDRVNGLVLVAGFTRVLPGPRLIGLIATTVPGIRERMTGWIYAQRYPPTPASFRRMRDAGNSFDGRRLLGRIRAPTLIVNGTRDPLVPTRITRELAEGIAGSTLVLVESDHLFAARDPELLLVPALSFLGEVDASAGPGRMSAAGA